MIGLLQGYFLRRSVLVANDAIQLSREEFNASHRPRIKVREIAIATDGFAKEPALIKGNIIPASGDPQMW